MSPIEELAEKVTMFAKRKRRIVVVAVARWSAAMVALAVHDTVVCLFFIALTVCYNYCLASIVKF